MISRIIKFFTNEWVIITAIMINSVLLFLIGYDQFRDNKMISILDHAFTVFFVLELGVKVGLYGWKKYINDSWNKFDFILVAISIPSIFELFIHIPDVSYLLVFRLLRVMRILRFMRFIPNISKMFSGIARAIRASAFIFVALVIYNVLIAVLSSHLFREEAPQYFGNPSISLYSIFQVFTVEGWNEISSTVVENTEPGTMKPVLTRIFFFVVVLTGGIFGMSIMNAIFVDEMTMDNNDELEAKVDELNAKMDRLLTQMENNSPPDKPV